MRSREIFYLHIGGEQRGPYTVPQIDHLLNSGLITEETLYWREGLEQWAPVTSLVVKRVEKRSWRRLIIGLAILCAVLLLGALFGPVIADGWREANQHRFTSEAAYWRARETVRSQALPRGTVVKFAPAEAAKVSLQPPGEAVVILPAEVVDSSGQMRARRFEVRLQFNERRAEWSGLKPVELPAS